MTARPHPRLLPALLFLLLPVHAGAQATPVKWPSTLESERASIRDETAGATPIQITTKLRYQTLIQLPDGDPIVEVLAGDGGSDEKPGNWIISASKEASTIHIKPTKPGADTNLNVITGSGAVYSFLLREGRADGKPVALPDLRVTVRSDRIETVALARKYYTAAEYDAVQGEVIALKAQLEGERQRAETLRADAEQTPEPGPMHFAYGPIPDVKPFHIKAIWHDGRFTYIKHGASESPSLYETKDGKPAIVDPKVPEPGLFVVHKVLDSGYLALGKARLAFALKD